MFYPLVDQMLGSSITMIVRCSTLFLDTRDTTTQSQALRGTRMDPASLAVATTRSSACGMLQDPGNQPAASRIAPRTLRSTFRGWYLTNRTLQSERWSGAATSEASWPAAPTANAPSTFGIRHPVTMLVGFVLQLPQLQSSGVTLITASLHLPTVLPRSRLPSGTFTPCL